MSERKSTILDGKTLYRDESKISVNGGQPRGPFVDWAESDEAYKAEATADMMAQGYTVKSITVGEPCLIDVV